MLRAEPSAKATAIVDALDLAQERPSAVFTHKRLVLTCGCCPMDFKNTEELIEHVTEAHGANVQRRDSEACASQQGSDSPRWPLGLPRLP